MTLFLTRTSPLLAQVLRLPPTGRGGSLRRPGGGPDGDLGPWRGRRRPRRVRLVRRPGDKQGQHRVRALAAGTRPLPLRVGESGGRGRRAGDIEAPTSSRSSCYTFAPVLRVPPCSLSHWDSPLPSPVHYSVPSAQVTVYPSMPHYCRGCRVYVAVRATDAGPFRPQPAGAGEQTQYLLTATAKGTTHPHACIVPCIAP